MQRIFLIGSLIATAACEDKVANHTEHAAERVTKVSSHLRHERRQLAAEVAERADDRAAQRDVTNADEIADEVADVSREAGTLAQAQADYEHLKALRVAALRAEHSVAASQPLLIQAISAQKTLAPAMRARLDDNMRIFRERLAATRDAIEQLQFVTAADWERRDDELGRQMAGLYLARDASWQVLDDDHREEPFPGT